MKSRGIYETPAAAMRASGQPTAIYTAASRSFKPSDPVRCQTGVHESIAMRAGRPAVMAAGEPAVPDGTGDGLAALVSRARAGDRVAFDALYAACVDRVYAVCLRLCADRATAERLTQDTFVQAWQRLGSFRGEAAFTTGSIASR